MLSGRNWRKLPARQAWTEAHPGKTLYIVFCTRLLKWRKDTSDEQAGAKDFSAPAKRADPPETTTSATYSAECSAGSDSSCA